MTADSPFRLALALVLLLTMSTAVWRRIQAGGAGDRISWKEEGYLFAAVLRLAGAALMLATVAYLVYPASLQWAALHLPAWLRWAGVATGLASSGLMYWTLAHLGRNLTDTVVVRSQATLVTSGPYAWVRHPYYVTTGLLVVSLTLLTANMLLGLLGLLVLALLAMRTPREEAMLIARFGDRYRRYMRRTRRFLPRRCPPTSSQ